MRSRRKFEPFAAPRTGGGKEYFSPRSAVGAIIQHLDPVAVWREFPTPTEMQRAAKRTPTEEELLETRSLKWGPQTEQVYRAVDRAMDVLRTSNLQGEKFWKAVDGQLQYKPERAATKVSCTTCGGTTPGNLNFCEHCGVLLRRNPCRRNPVSMKRKAEVIARALGLDDRTNAEHVAGLISGKLDPEEFESVQKRVRQCYHKPRHAELVMEALNEVLAGFGVEAIRSEYAYVDSFHRDIIATYVNQGDSDLPTVIYETARDKFVIEAVGDWVERNERKYRIR